MKLKLRYKLDLVVLLACYLAPLLFTWPYSPLLSAVLTGSFIAGLLAILYTEEPTEASWFPPLTALLLCVKAFLLSMMATPTWPNLDLASGLCYAFYLFVATCIVGNACASLSRINEAYQEGTEGRLLAISADLHSGHYDFGEATSRRDRVRRAAGFYEQCNRLGWYLRYEVVLTLFVLLTLGISEPLYIIGHLFLSFLVSTNLGLLVANANSSGNLS